MLRRKSKQFDGFEDLFFWGRESAEVVFTLDNYLLAEFEGKRVATDFANDRNLLTIQRIVVRELILLEYLKLDLTIFGAKSWGFKATFHSDLVIENEARNNFAPIWIWWPEFWTSLDVPTSSDFLNMETFNAYNDQFVSGDTIGIGFGEINVMPSIPGAREWKDNMAWARLPNDRKSELIEFLVGILSENEMKPMEFLLICLALHPDTPEDDISFLSAVLRSKDLDLPQSISSAVEKRLQSSGD
jgi:hypothetical protein